jgi:hypothetical protein
MPGEIYALTGADIYKVRACLSSTGPGTRKIRIVIAAVDTAAGVVLVHSDRLPVGVSVTPRGASS